MDISGEKLPIPYEENTPLYDLIEITNLVKQAEDILLGKIGQSETGQSETGQSDKEITVQQWGERYDYGSPEFGLFNPNSFEESIKVYRNIKVNTISDENGQTYYHFSCESQNGILSPYLNELTIISFDSFAGSLLNINNIVIPLHEFINVTRMEEIVPQTDACSNHQLRCEPTIGYGVNCYSVWSNREFALPNTSIPLIMRAIGYFQVIERDNSKVIDEYCIDTLKVPDSNLSDICVNSSSKNEGLFTRCWKAIWG
jgi:hypothetical protein